MDGTYILLVSEKLYKV